LQAQISTTIVSTLDEAADIVAAYTHPDLLPRRLTVKVAKPGGEIGVTGGK